MTLISSLNRPLARRAAFAALLLALAGLGADLFSAAAQAPVTVVNAASFEAGVAPDAIAAAFGQYVTQNNQTYSATAVPLPTTLGGVSVKVDGVDAGLFFVGPTQINFAVPTGIADGARPVVVTNSDASTRSGTATVSRAFPGIFTALSSGSGAVSALTTFDGITYERTANADGSLRPIQPSTQARPNVLVLYGTGWRNAGAGNVRVTIQGVPARVDFAGPVSGFVGLDQANVVIPPELAGFGTVHVKLIANGIISNEDTDPMSAETPETINIGGQQTPVRFTDIAVGQSVNGTLTIEDQVQPDDNAPGESFFFDAYRFTTSAPNTAVAIDLRSGQFDALTVLYRVLPDNNLDPIAVDDETGGLGNGRPENNNALLVTVIQNPGEYLIFATTATNDANAVGTYTLSLATAPVQPIAYGTDLPQASIANTDLRNSAGDYFDVYSFTAAAGDRARIAMTSAAFNSFLFLNGNDGVLREFDDDSGGGSNAVIEYQFSAGGTYLIFATPYEPDKFGNYTLSLTRGSGFADAEQLRAPSGRTLRHQYRRGGLTRRQPQARGLERNR